MGHLLGYLNREIRKPIFSPGSLAFCFPGYPQTFLHSSTDLLYVHNYMYPLKATQQGHICSKVLEKELHLSQECVSVTLAKDKVMA